MVKRFAAPLSVLWTLALYCACAQTSYPDQQGTTVDRSLSGQQTVDCTDPANAGTAACFDSTGNASGSQVPGEQGLGSNPYGSNQNRSSSPNGLQNQNGVYVDNGGLRPTNSAEVLNNLRRRQLRPEPLTEFQRLVADSAGEVLPVFGADMFREVPSTYSPLDQVPVTADYVIGPGDELRVRIWGQVDLNASVRVDRAGAIYLPQVGQIHVAGLQFSELDKHVRDAVARVYRNFELNVDLGQLRSIQVFVVGQARFPGSYTISSLSTLVNALFAAGGPSLQGSMRHIQLKRGIETVTEFDLYDLLLNGDKSKDLHLLTGDVIFIPAVGPQVALAGSIRTPAIYELSGPTTIKQVMEYAGGRSAVAAGSRASVERISDHQQREAMEISLDETGLATVLQDGDFVRLLSIVPRFGKTVTLRGNVADPGRFSWHAGMHLSELIPDRESLVTRNYWWRRTSLGLPALEFQPLSQTRTLNQPNYQTDLPRTQDFYPNGEPDYSGRPVPFESPSRRPGTNGQYSSQNPDQNQNNAQRNAQNNGQSSNDAQNADPNMPSRQSNGSEPQASGSTVAGQQTQLVTQNVAAATTKLDVRLSAPEIDWSYAVIERLDPATLKTSLLPFDLGKLVLQHDASQDLALQAGDVITVFSQADIRVPLEQQTKFVRLEGEFASSGVYSVHPGETLRQLVNRAGGFSQNAYLFGSEFTRQSTRVAQQQRLNEYVHTVELELQRNQMALAAAGVPGDPTQESLLARLRQLRATGRIVLEMKPNSSGSDSLPDLPLEDGDRFEVPPVPADVKVVGSVYNQNSFVYRNSRRTADYLKLAGGPNRNADRSHSFVIRADGSVISRKSSSSVWGNTFAAMHLNPGDTIVVPEKTLRPTVLKSILDWSQVFSQLALGAAAVNVIK